MRYFQHESRKAIWSQRIALVFLMLFLITFALHRFSQINTPVAMQLFGVAVSGAVVALLLGLTAFVGIWREGHKGAGRAITGALVSGLLLALPLWSLPNLMALPRIHDVTTDTRSPPKFEKIANVRQAGANPADYQRDAVEVQQQAYPDLQPVTVKRSATEAFSAVREAITTLKWRIVAEEPPQSGRPGAIEATDKSMIFGFTDDVVVRVSGNDDGARIDARSSSRYGEHDLGRNATRVREFFSEVKTRLAAIDTGEQMQKAVLQREEQAKKARKKQETSKKSRAWRDELDRSTERPATPPREANPPQISAVDPSKPQPGASGVNSQPGRTLNPSQNDPGSERALSREDARYERRRTRRQRRAERNRAARKFWEQFGGAY